MVNKRTTIIHFTIHHLIIEKQNRLCSGPQNQKNKKKTVGFCLQFLERLSTHHTSPPPEVRIPEAGAKGAARARLRPRGQGARTAVSEGGRLQSLGVWLESLGLCMRTGTWSCFFFFFWGGVGLGRALQFERYDFYSCRKLVIWLSSMLMLCYSFESST